MPLAHWPGATDRVVFSRGSGNADALQIDGSAGFVRTVGGKAVSWALFDGRKLAFQNQTLVTLPQPGIKVNDGKE